MQTLTRMDKVVIEHFYHMTTMDENMNWMELTHLLSKKILNLRALLYIYIHTRENNASPLCILCMLMD